MSQSLEARLLEPPLCHTFPGKPTCLAYDERNAHIAVGCNNGKVSVLFKNGQVKVLSTVNENGTPKDDEPVKLMSFCYEMTTSKTFLVTSLNDSTQVFLWSLTGESKCVSKFIGDRITVLTWSLLSSTLYVGTGDGDVMMMKVTDSPSLALDEPDQSFIATRVYGEVITVKESPNQDLVLIVYSTGICLMKSKETNTIDKYDPKSKRVLVNAWWKNDDTFILLYKTGFFDIFKYTPSLKDHFAQQGELISVGNSGITKAQWIFIPTKKETVTVCAGSYHLSEKFDKSHIITTFYTKEGKASSYPLKPFSDPVVDFVLAQDKKSNESLLVVLTESRINLVSPTEGNFVKDGGMNVLQYHRYDPLVFGYPYITQPVTCIHFFGECSKEFIASNFSEEQSEATPELVVTGHSDGSIRLWLCYCIDGSLSFKLIRMVFNTEVYFENQEKKLSAVSHVKVIDGQYLLVIKESERVLLFRLWKIEKDIEPHSQEVYLREGCHGLSNPPGTLKTPPPHFRPRKERHNNMVQLLQHFSCHYQSGPDQPLEPVTVNCAVYNGQMEMLAVGTKYCLVVVDVKTNMLVQVIRSENKLLKLSRGVNDDLPGCSQKSCDVVCLEALKVSWKEYEEAQLTLLVGTRGENGTMGSLKITRKKGQVLELEATELGKVYKNSALREIHYYQKKDLKILREIPETEFKVEGEEVIIYATAHVAVITEKLLKTYQIPGLAATEFTSKEFKAGGIIWSGLVQSGGKPFIVYVTVTKDGHKLAGICLTDFKYTISKNLPAGCHPVEQDLFSSNGKHAIMKCSDQFYYIMDSF